METYSQSGNIQRAKRRWLVKLPRMASISVIKINGAAIAAKIT